MNPKAVDLFAGAGGTALGLRWAGFDVILAAEVDPIRATYLSTNHPQVHVLGANGTNGDVRKIRGSFLKKRLHSRRRLDLLVACPPCQGYSSIGLRKVSDPRNILYVDFVRLVRKLRPKALVFENVPGMLRLANGSYFNDLLERLDSCGYDPTLWRLMASDQGVPQLRERIFVVGLRDMSPGKPPQKKREINVWEAIADLPIATTRGMAGNSLKLQYRSKPKSSYSARMRGKSVTVTGCGRTLHSQEILKRFHALRWKQRDSATRHRRLHPHRPATTITAGCNNMTACRPVHPYQDRVLTVREAARLSSFPDWYVFPSQIHEAWAQIGNSVPPEMARNVFDRVSEFIAHR